MRILLADDDHTMLKTVTGMLSAVGEVDAVADGRALVEAALRLQPDLIVTDLTMPLLSGIQAVRQLRAAGSTTPIIVLSIHNDPDLVAACIAAGALGFVDKRRLNADLLAAVAEVAGGRSFLSPSVRTNR